MKPHTFDTTFAPPEVVLHENSRTISKVKPKIRIIHIVAPEIIKTDVENFRVLVQRLTGKPVERKGSPVERKGSTNRENNASTQVLQPRPYSSKTSKNIELAGLPILQDTQRKKEVEEINRGENPNAFASFLADVDGFLHDINEFPLLSFRSSQINAFGEMPLCS